MQTFRTGLVRVRQKRALGGLKLVLSAGFRGGGLGALGVGEEGAPGCGDPWCGCGALFSFSMTFNMLSPELNQSRG